MKKIVIAVLWVIKFFPEGCFKAGRLGPRLRRSLIGFLSFYNVMRTECREISDPFTMLYPLYYNYIRGSSLVIWAKGFKGSSLWMQRQTQPLGPSVYILYPRYKYLLACTLARPVTGMYVLGALAKRRTLRARWGTWGCRLRMSSQTSSNGSSRS